MRATGTARTAADTAADGKPPHDRGRNLVRRLRRHLAREPLVPPGAHVLVAVSGGLDSVSLLHLLRFAEIVPGARLSVAHFDHAMRPGSEADSEWVSGLCRAWGLPRESARAAVPPRNESEARHLRYAFLRRAASRVGAERILTAHHADDQAETVLFRALRGTGPRGLRGIAERRGRLVRPLLPFRRRELESYASAVGLGFREDPTNRLPDYTRNRIRHEIMPGLEDVVPGAAAALARLAGHAHELDGALRWLMQRLLSEAMLASDDAGFELARPTFLSYHPHFRARLVRHLLCRLGSYPDSAGTRAALQFITRVSSGRVFHAPGGVMIEREFDRIRIRRTPAPAMPDRPLTITEPVAGSGTAVVGGVDFRVEWGPGPGANAGNRAVFDLAALRFPLHLRGWRPGDRLRLKFGTKKLKKLFMEHRIGRARRPSLPVLTDGAGNVLWVPGLARASVHEPGRAPLFHVVVTVPDIRGN